MRTPFLAALALAAAPALAQTADPATLEDRLVGNTFQGDMGGGGYASYFAPGGTYHDAAGTGRYEITSEGVCYPETEYGCYQATITDDTLTWSQDGEDMGSGRILEGDALGFASE